MGGQVKETKGDVTDLIQKVANIGQDIERNNGKVANLVSKTEEAKADPWMGFELKPQGEQKDLNLTCQVARPAISRRTMTPRTG